MKARHNAQSFPVYTLLDYMRERASSHLFAVMLTWREFNGRKVTFRFSPPPSPELLQFASALFLSDVLIRGGGKALTVTNPMTSVNPAEYVINMC